MPSALYDDIQARAPRTEPDAERIEGEGQSAPVVLIHGASPMINPSLLSLILPLCLLSRPTLLRRTAKSLALLANDLVFGLRIRIPFRVRLGSPAALSDRCISIPTPSVHVRILRLRAGYSFASLRQSALDDMHCDHSHCPPAFCSCTTPDAMRSATTKRLPSCFVYDLTLKASPPRTPAAPTVLPHSRRLRGLLIRHRRLLSSPLDVPSTYGSGSAPRMPPTPGTNHEHHAHAMRVTYPCAATLCPTICSTPGPVVQCVYVAHHHERTQHTPHHHATFVPSRARSPSAAPIRPHRSTLLLARTPPVSSNTCVRSVHRGHSPPSALRGAPIPSDHRADPFSRPTTRRHLRLLYAAQGQQRVTRLRRCGRCMRCARGERTSAWRRRAAAVRRNQDPAVLPLARARRLQLPLENADSPQARAGEKAKGLLTGDCWRNAATDGSYIYWRFSFIAALYIVL
ncbi:hypothetical protein K438DRAFT_1968473 [Mycena galopus ATCC 62051]|nr:hypothetical protein K438DRAFT_1968473 [Mycena galopus ATCC 62051]